MITKEKTKEFIDRAYKIACEHGFHDEERSNAHWMMLVVSEIGEMVEADRNNSHAIYDAIEYCDKHVDEVDVSSRNRYFERDVKNTLEDELADVCIRLYDFCGAFGVEPEDFSRYLNGDFVYTWTEEFGGMSVCEQCYELVRCVCEISGDSSADEISETVSAALLYCFCFAQHHGIDLERHIELKMRYNESREVRHGKQY